MVRRALPRPARNRLSRPRIVLPPLRRPFGGRGQAGRYAHLERDQRRQLARQHRAYPWARAPDSRKRRQSFGAKRSVTEAMTKRQGDTRQGDKERLIMIYFPFSLSPCLRKRPA